MLFFGKRTAVLACLTLCLYVCQPRIFLSGSCSGIRVSNEDQQFRTQGVLERKWKFPHCSFKKLVIVCIFKERKTKLFTCSLWEFWFWVITMEMCPNLGYKYSQTLPDWIGTHMLSWDYFRLSKAWTLIFCFPESISYHSIFSHGKHYYYFC